MLENVQQVMIKPIIKATIEVGSLIYTDEYNLMLCRSSYEHKSVCHAQGEYARDEDNDGFVRCINWQDFGPCCSWLRPIEAFLKLPLYLGFSSLSTTLVNEETLLGALLETLLP